MKYSEDLGKLVLRIGISAFMLTHGFPKLNKLIAGESFADPIGIGSTPSLILTVFAEFVCPIFIILGFKTRWAAFFPLVTMLVAAFIVHGSDPWNKKEFALLYGVGFLAIMLLGSGKYAIQKD